jgi:hypothetical protein
MPAKLNFFKTPAPERLVSTRPVSTSTGISGCFQPGQAKVGPGPTPLVRTEQQREESKDGRNFLYAYCMYVLTIVQ